EAGEEREITTGKDGIISFDKLRPGIYKLEEIEPAPGYEKANTDWTVRITTNGKVYIKDNKKQAGAETNAALSVEQAASSSSSNRIIQYLAQNSASLNGVNTGLQFGPEMVEAALRAGNGWKQVDPNRSENPDTRANPDNPTRVYTKITEINKGEGTKQFKQIFLINGNDNANNDFNLNIHRQPKGTLAQNQVSVRVFTVGQGSTVDKILTPGKDLKLQAAGIEDLQNPGQLKIRFNGSGNPGFSKNNLFVIEVISTYTDNTNLGLGMDYYYNRSGVMSNWKKYWGAQSYTSADAINREAYRVTATSQGNGTVTAKPSENIAKDTEVTVNVEPNPRYELDKLTVDGKDVTQDVDNNQYTFKMPNHSVNVQASFKEKTYNVYTQSPVGGTLKVDKTKAKANETITVTAEANDDYEFKSITYRDTAGTEHTVTGNSFTMPASDVTVSATFKKKADPNPDYSVKVNPVENGQVTANPTSAKKDDKVTITASPAEGFVLDTLTVKDGAGNPVEVTNNSFAMPAGDVTVSATFKKPETPDQPGEGEIEIKPGEAAQITNKQTGLDLKIFKRDSNSRPLEGGKFTLKKTDENYTKEDTIFKKIEGISGKDGKLVFTDSKDKQQSLALEPGYYVLEETEAPSGYKEAQAPWKIHVYEDKDTNQLKADYQGPDETPNSFVSSDKALDNFGNTTGIKTTENRIKYAARMTHINTEGKTYIQRIYIDTREYNHPVNVQIKPVEKREEIDTPGQHPVTTKEGVKTAYRSTYKITGLNGDPNPAKLNDIFRNYTIANDDVSVVNTARWRPFDWGFDEDQLNLDPGVYYIDVEGFYDDNITKEN
ncbi:MAG: SpaA isopeptide-forming pilin-related protein, partial [Finegoldia magna]|nr:SpaA isopeptide-forming pilin-related protein [Finegoldia magna]